MNKKTTGLLCLAAGLLVGAAVAAPSSIALVKANEGGLIATMQYAIELPTIDGVQFTVRDQAAAGEVVEIRLVVDDNKISYTGDLLVNGWRASMINDTTFKFVMPAEKAVITLEYGKVEEEVTTYNVTKIVPEGMYLEDLGAAYEAGANVAFKITFDAFAGITWNGMLEIYAGADDEKEDIAYTQRDDGYFVFEMPAKDITVKAEAENRNYNIKRAEGDNSSYKAFGDIELLAEEGDPTRLFEGGDLYSKAARVEFKSMVRVHMRNFSQDYPSKGAYAPLGFRIKETKQQFLLEDDKDYIDIEMPGRDITLEAIVTDRHFALTLNGGEHTSIEVYHKDENGAFVKDAETVPTALYSENVYVRVLSSDAGFGVSKLHVLAVNEARDSSGNPVNGLDKDLEFDPVTGFYALNVNGIFESIALNVTEAAVIAANPTATAGEHTVATVYAPGNDGLVALDENNHAVPGNAIFVKVTSADGEYGGKAVSGTYAKADETEGTLSFTRSGEYYVAMLPADAASFAVTATEQKVFNNTGLVGEYVGRSLTVSSGNASTNSYLNEVTPAGTFAYGTSNAYAMQELTPEADGAAYGTFTAKKGTMDGSYSAGYTLPETQDKFTNNTLYRFAYSEKVLAWQESALEATAANYSPINSSATTIALAFKKNLNSDAAFAFYTAKVTANNNQYIFGQAMYGDEVWANVFFNISRGEYKIDNQLEINLLAGDNIAANDAFFSVSYAGENLYNVGSDAKGNKVFLDGFQGEWAVGNETLTLDGINKATYEGHDFEYVLNNGTLTLTRLYVTADGGVTETVVIDSFDLMAHTAALVSQTASDPVPYVIALETQNVTIGSRTTSYGFSYDPATGAYTSTNQNQNSTNAEMSITVYKTIQLSFDYETSGDWSATSNYDYFGIFKNGVEVDRFGDASGKYEIVLNAGDVLSLVYSKDSSVGGDMDGVKITNLQSMIAGPEAGTYAVDGKTDVVVLDGYGHGTYGEISFNYTVNNGAIEPVMVNNEITEEEGRYYKEGQLLTFDVAAMTVTDTPQKVELAEVKPTITYSTSYPFTFDPATGTYTSGNAGVATSGGSDSYMYIEAPEDGVIVFNYVAGGEGQYDYATISIDGVEKTNTKGTGSSAHNTGTLTFKAELKKGQKVTIRFHKDYSGDEDIDSIVVSNLAFYA